MPEIRPDDLLSVDDAARLVGRSKSTVRAWVRGGEVQGHREDPAHPENSRLLVSAAAVKRRADDVPVARDPEPARVPTPDADAQALRAEVDRLRAGMVTAMQGRVDALEGRIADLSRAIEAERLRGEEWRARALGAEAEREALRRERGLPWWRRLLGAPAELTPPIDMKPLDD
jgi:hypothetical protein